MTLTTLTTGCCIALLVSLSACSQDKNNPAATASTKQTVASNTAIDTTPADAVAATPAKTQPKLPRITVYKSPTCGCCSGWVSYLKDEGLAVTAIDTDDVDTVKTENGLTDKSLMSCHTALVDGYIIEGHVPVADIKKLLSERPKNIKGLTAPGMPMYSPGMASLIPKDYDVLSFTESGETAVYSSY